MAKKRRSFFDDFFGEGFEELMDQMLRDLQEGRQPKPFIYGFSMTQHPGAAPEVREFGNIQPFGRSVKMEDERKPLIDVMETTDEVHVIAEMPGVDRTDVQLDSISKHKTSLENTLKALNSPSRLTHTARRQPTEMAFLR